MTETKRGGKREGAGRKPEGKEPAKKVIGLRVTDDVRLKFDLLGGKDWFRSILNEALAANSTISALPESRGIYVIVNRITGVSYVGQSENIKQRASGHISDLRNNRHPNKALQSDWLNFGQAAFIFSVAMLCDESDDLLSIERHIISLQDEAYNGKQGKPRLSETDETIKVLVVVTESQRAKFKRLGGSAWVRAMIDREAGNV